MYMYPILHHTENAIRNGEERSHRSSSCPPLGRSFLGSGCSFWAEQKDCPEECMTTNSDTGYGSMLVMVQSDLSHSHHPPKAGYYGNAGEDVHGSKTRTEDQPKFIDASIEHLLR
jgi:hypothetical protein